MEIRDIGRTISIVGASGFVGTGLYNYLNSELKDFSVYGTYFSNKSNENFDFLDITDKKNLEDYLIKIKPDFLIWLSGWKPVRCEEDYSSAIDLHIKPLIDLLEIIDKNKLGTKIIFLSSDYVFDGKRGSYSENDKTSPETNYGKLKRAGEQLLLTLGNHIIIVRSSAVMGRGGVFFEWVLNEINKGENIKAFSDIYFSPTPMGFFNEIMKKIILEYDDLCFSTIHVSGGKRMSRYEFIRFIAKLLNSDPDRITADVRGSTEDSRSPESFFGKDLSLIPSDFVKENIYKSFEDYMMEELE